MANPKDSTNSQFARVSTNGIRGYTQSDNEGSAPLCDEHGRLIVVDSNAPTPDPFPNSLNIQEINLVAPFIITITTAKMGAIEGHVRDVPSFPCWLQISEDQFVNPGNVPLVILPINANQRLFSYAIPMTFSNFLSFNISSTELTYTAIVGASFAMSGVIYTP